MNQELENRIQLFENRKIRTAWDEETEEWYFSIVDVIGVLTEQADHQKARKYWKTNEGEEPRIERRRGTQEGDGKERSVDTPGEDSVSN